MAPLYNNPAPTGAPNSSTIHAVRRRAPGPRVQTRAVPKGRRIQMAVYSPAMLGKDNHCAGVFAKPESMISRPKQLIQNAYRGGSKSSPMPLR